MGKFLLVTENLGSGGAERQLVGLAVALKDRGYEPVVVTWHNKNFHKNTLDKNNIPHFLLVPKSKLHRVRLLVSIFRELKPDAVISFLPMANETASLASFLCPVNLIVSERSFTTNWGIRRKLTNLLYKRAKYIVANSNNEADNIRKHCKSLASKVVTIPNFVDTERFVPNINSIYKRSETIRLIGVGRVIPTKNLLNLLKALHKVKEDGVKFTFDWYGATENKEHLAEVSKLINELGLEKCFKLKGEAHKIEEAYQAAHFMCFPSFLEGYPNVLIEAMACGLPIVASSVCENPFIVEDRINGFLFDPHDIDSIANSIIRAINLSESEYSKISKNNRYKVITNNTLGSFIDSYIELILD